MGELRKLVANGVFLGIAVSRKVFADGNQLFVREIEVGREIKFIRHHTNPAGGIGDKGKIIFLIGMEMVLGRNIFHHEDLEASSASIVPIAFPLIAGAGTMTTLISLRAAYEIQNIVVGVVLNLIFIYLVLKSSGYIEQKLGKGGLEVMRKVFGIILLAIAIKLIKDNFFLVHQLS